jgi:hypothetical protein
MAKYAEMLNACREARRASLMYLEEHRHFAIKLVRDFIQFANVPRDRFDLSTHSEEDGFHADRWFHQPFVIRFPDYEAADGGETDLTVVWRLRSGDGDWLVKTHVEGEPYSIRTDEDRQHFFEAFADEIQSWLSTTLQDAIESPEDLNEQEKQIGFRIPSSSEALPHAVNPTASEAD